MKTISTLINFLSMFKPFFTKAAFENIEVLFSGAVLSYGPRTITGCMKAVYFMIKKHWTSYENTIRKSPFNMLLLAKRLFAQIVSSIPREVPLLFIVDESLVRRYGPYVTGVRMHRDAVRSSHTNLVLTPGNKWVILAIAVSLPFSNRYFALPILSLLYLTHKEAKRNKTESPYHKHRTVVDLTLIMLKWVVRWAPNKRFLLLGDGAYATHRLADLLNPKSNDKRLRNGVLVSRFRLDGVTYREPPKRSDKPKAGEPAVKGERLPSPREVAGDKKTQWIEAEVDWYSGMKKKVLLLPRTGLWYKCGYKPTKIKWVVVKDPEGKKADEAFFSTDINMAGKEIVETFVKRWPLETTFQEAREHLGLETLRNRNKTSILRSVPMLLSVYSIIVTWFTTQVKDPKSFILQFPWYEKDFVTFSDMLFAARANIRVSNKSYFEQNNGEFLLFLDKQKNKDILRKKEKRKTA